MKAIPALYIHIPFCKRTCPYCGFYSVPDQVGIQAGYVAAVEREGGLRGVRQGEAPSVYVGGGTPTALGPDVLARVLEYGRRMAAPGAEYTVEVNPGTVTPDTAALLRRYGVTRISCGVQSFDDGILRTLGRIHDADTAVRTVAVLRDAGFVDISVDLMFAVPGQDDAAWEASLHKAVGLEPTHISLYGLSIEPGTVFARRVADGSLVLPDGEAYARMYEHACRALPEHGYIQYELSNFARPGRECRHNLAYWHRAPYVGLGASAHSYRPFRRWWNDPDIESYVTSLKKGEKPHGGCEELDGAARLHEAVFLGLRTLRGVRLAGIVSEFGNAAEKELLARAAVPARKGLLEQRDGFLRLTPRALAVADAVTAALL